MGSLTGMSKYQAQKLSADVHIFCVPLFISSSCHFEHVLRATKSPRKKSSLSSASQYVGKKKRTDSTLEVRLLPGHYSHSFVEAGLISLQAVIQENCLEKNSGPRLQHLVFWQIQQSPWRHRGNVLSFCLSVCLSSRDVVREPMAPSRVLGKQNGHLWLVKWWCVLIVVPLLNATLTHIGQKCDLVWSVITTTGC